MNTRHLFLIIKTFLFLLPSSLTGQINTIGISSGITCSSILANDEIEINRLPIFAYTQGLTGSLELKENWFLSLGVSGEKKGYRINFYKIDVFGNEYGEPHDISFEMKYLTVPVSINFQTKNKIKVYTGLGMHLSILMKAVSTSSLFEPQYDQNGVPTFEWKEIGKQVLPFTQEYKRVDASIAWQGGVRIPVAENLTFDLKAGFDHGVIPILKKGDEQNLKYFNRSGSIMVGIFYTCQN